MGKFKMNDLLNNQSKAPEKEKIQIEKSDQNSSADVDIKTDYLEANEEAYSINRTPEIIAIEINSIKDQTINLVLYNSIEIGRRLTEAKQLIPHGQWKNWLSASVSYSKSTANNLMRIFEEYGSNQITLIGNNAKSQALGNLSYTQAIALLGIPEDEREAFISENDINSMSTRDLNKLIKEKLEVEEKLKKANKKIKDMGEKNKEQIINKEVEIENLKMYLKNVTEEINGLKDSINNDNAEELQERLRYKEIELCEANTKVENLSKLLKEKPIEIIAETQEESVLKYLLYLEQFINNFEKLFNQLEGLSEEARDKYKSEAKIIITTMEKRL